MTSGACRRLQEKFPKAPRLKKFNRDWKIQSKIELFQNSIENSIDLCFWKSIEKSIEFSVFAQKRECQNSIENSKEICFGILPLSYQKAWIITETFKRKSFFWPFQPPFPYTVPPSLFQTHGFPAITWCLVLMKFQHIFLCTWLSSHQSWMF